MTAPDLSPEALAALDAKAAAATPGPWESLDNGDRVVAWRRDHDGLGVREFDYVIPEPMDSAADAAYIAAADPPTVRALIAALTEARAEVERLRVLAVDGHIEDDDRSGYCLCGAEWICPVWIEEVSLSDRAAESTRILGQLIDTQGQRDAAEARLAAVRALHAPGRGGHECVMGDGAPSDCDTIRAIEGES